MLRINEFSAIDEQMEYLVTSPIQGSGNVNEKCAERGTIGN